MKFAVLSLNPGIDRALYLSDPMNPGHMNRAARTVTSQGSKGANVSVVLHRLGFDVTYYAFTGGLYGELCEKIIAAEGLKAKYTGTACGIRVNTKVTDCNRLCTEFNEKGGPVTPEEYEALTQSFLQDDAEVVYMCGSFPQGVEKTAYRDLVAAEKSLGRKVILDCDGDALINGIQSSPDIIKPNTDELIGLLRRTGMCKNLPQDPQGTPGFMEKACAKVAAKYGIDTVLCTMGPKGALGISKGKTFFCEAAPVELRGFSGAGDTFLAGFGAARYALGMDDAAALRYASACAGAKIVLEGTTLPTKEGVDEILKLM